MYKFFTKILNNRLTNEIDQYQPVENAGSRKNDSTCDRFLTMRIVIEKAVEYNLNICKAFVGSEGLRYRWTLGNITLSNARIDSRYTQLIEYMYENATSIIQLNNTTAPIDKKEE